MKRFLDKLVQKLGCRTYRDYLKTEHWESFTRRVKSTRCYCCMRGGTLQIHHLTYERIGRELPSDVITVCLICHKKIHKLSKTGIPLRIAHLILRERLLKKRKTK